MARTIHGDHEKFLNTYFRRYPGLYFTGDGALRDEDGHYQITGRVDDVINVKGHRIGTAELESCMVSKVVIPVCMGPVVTVIRTCPVEPLLL